jgi:hypothetical protein
MPNMSFSPLKESAANEPLMSLVFNDLLIMRRKYWLMITNSSYRGKSRRGWNKNG